MKNLLYSFAICMLAFSISSCSKSGGDSIDTFIPDLSQGWKNTADASDEYFFNADSTNVPTGTFTGHEDKSGDESDFAGTFQNSKISFTFSSGTKNGLTYSGTISKASGVEKMTLNTNAGTLALQRDQ